MYDIARAVGVELAQQGCPYRVVYGPERFTDIAALDTRIVFSRVGAQEEITHNISQRSNPKPHAIRSIGAIVRVIASSTTAGARREDHERIADSLVDILIVAIRKVCAQMRVECRFTTGRFLDADDADMPELESWPGVVYELTTFVDRGVCDRTWAGDARQETTEYTFASGGCVREGTEEA